MSDLVGNPEDRFSHNEAHIGLSKEEVSIKSIYTHLVGGYFSNHDTTTYFVKTQIVHIDIHMYQDH